MRRTIAILLLTFTTSLNAQKVDFRPWEITSLERQLPMPIEKVINEDSIHKITITRCWRGYKPWPFYGRWKKFKKPNKKNIEVIYFLKNNKRHEAIRYDSLKTLTDTLTKYTEDEYGYGFFKYDSLDRLASVRYFAWKKDRLRSSMDFGYKSDTEIPLIGVEKNRREQQVPGYIKSLCWISDDESVYTQTTTSGSEMLIIEILKYPELKALIVYKHLYYYSRYSSYDRGTADAQHISTEEKWIIYYE